VSEPRGDAPLTASSWTATLAGLPRHIVQPFGLSAVAVVGAVLLGVSGAYWAAITALGAAVALLVIGLRATPQEAIGSLVAGNNYQPVSHLDVDTPVDSRGLSSDRGGRLGPLEAIYFLHLYQNEGGSFGRYKNFPVDYFVDLMTAALVPSHLDCMTREMAAHVRRCGKLDGVTTVAGPKRGNPLLLVATANELGLEPVFVKERPLFGKTLEGIGGRPKRAILFDDISSDGQLLVNCVQVLREAGYAVSDAFVLVDRPEGDSEEALAEVGVRLWPLHRLADQDLESLAARGRRTLAT
jgi:orotate phosphoribosyltransferase